MKVSLICVGKLKEKYLTMAVDEYKKRLSRYCTLDIIELPDEKTPDNAGKALEEAIKKKEGQRILRVLKEDSFCIALAIQGNMLSSEQLALYGKTICIGKKPYKFCDWGLLRSFRRSPKAGPLST